MITKEEQRILALINNAVRPLSKRLDQAERDVRKAKSEVQQLKNTVARLKR